MVACLLLEVTLRIVILVLYAILLLSQNLLFEFFLQPPRYAIHHEMMDHKQKPACVVGPGNPYNRKAPAAMGCSSSERLRCAASQSASISSADRASRSHSRGVGPNAVAQPRAPHGSPSRCRRRLAGSAGARRRDGRPQPAAPAPGLAAQAPCAEPAAPTGSNGPDRDRRLKEPMLDRRQAHRPRHDRVGLLCSARSGNCSRHRRELGYVGLLFEQLFWVSLGLPCAPAQ